MGTPILYGWIDRELYAQEGRVTVVGPYATRTAALNAAARYGSSEVVEVHSRAFDDVADFSDVYLADERAGGTGEDTDARVERCGACGTLHERLPMSDTENAVYDAIFGNVLHWSEDDDCDMNALMRDVAVAAAAAAVPDGYISVSEAEAREKEAARDAVNNVILGCVKALKETPGPFSYDEEFKDRAASQLLNLLIK